MTYTVTIFDSVSEYERNGCYHITLHNVPYNDLEMFCDMFSKRGMTITIVPEADREEE